MSREYVQGYGVIYGKYGVISKIIREGKIIKFIDVDGEIFGYNSIWKVYNSNSDYHQLDIKELKQAKDISIHKLKWH